MMLSETVTKGHVKIANTFDLHPLKNMVRVEQSTHAHAH